MIRKGRLARLARLGGMATGLVADAAGAGAHLLTETTSQASEHLHRKAAERMLRVFGDMKGLPLKAGQMLSYVDEFVPPEHRHIYEEILGTLQRDTPPMPWSEVERVFVEDLDRPVDELFARFDTEPIAAASIGQVYKAALHDGTDVVVKVQYPGVREALEADIANASTLVSAMSAVMPQGDFRQLIDQITHSLVLECDYIAELQHQERFREVWADDPQIHVPRPFPELSGPRVLVSEYVDAMDWPTMIARTDLSGRSDYGTVLFRFVFTSLLNHGMFNGDPHPGNYLFHPDGGVTFIDFGCTLRYPPEQTAAFHTLRDHLLERTPGGPFPVACRRAFTIPDDLDPDVLTALDGYLDHVFEPVTAPQPYRWTREYSTEMLRHTNTLKLQFTKKLLQGKKAYPLDLDKADGSIAYLGRIVFGLGSILATLGTEGDFRAMVAQMG